MIASEKEEHMATVSWNFPVNGLGIVEMGEGQPLMPVDDFIQAWQREGYAASLQQGKDGLMVEVMVEWTPEDLDNLAPGVTAWPSVRFNAAMKRIISESIDWQRRATSDGAGE